MSAPPVDLAADNNGKINYSITTYDMSYGVKSDKAVYNVSIVSDKHDITVKGLNEKGEEYTDTLTYREGDTATVSARVASDKYFNKWTAVAKDSDGNAVADIDVSKIIKKGDLNSESITMLMPKANDGQYPQGYSIELTASYGDRINSVTAIPEAAPVAGQQLAETIPVSFDGGTTSADYQAVWTYTDSDNNTVAAPAEAYNETEYTATVTIAADVAKGILFTPEVSAAVAEGTDASIVETKIARSPEDGSVTIALKFPVTGDEGNIRPDDTSDVTIVMFDLNRQTTMDEETFPLIKVAPDSEITLTAPAAENEVFYQWDLGNSGLSLTKDSKATDRTIRVKADTNLSASAQITASYIPLVTKVEAAFGKDGKTAPIGGQALPSKDDVHVFVTVSNKYEISPENVELTWEPEAAGEEGKADYQTVYTAQIKVVKNDQGKIKARVEGSDQWIDLAAQYFLSDTLTATCNGKDAVINKAEIAADPTVDPVMSYSFPVTKYNLAAIEAPESVSRLDNSKNNTSSIKGLLPDTVMLVLDNGSEVEAADVYWSRPKSDADDSREAATWTVNGKVELPDTVENRDDIELTTSMTLSVNSADAAASPEASLAPGEYMGDQSVTLTTKEAKGTTYYTLDGSDPTKASDSRHKYNGETIDIIRGADNNIDELDKDGNKTGRKEVVIKAVTVKEGKWDSAVASYEYVFQNELSIPSDATLVYNGEGQVGFASSPYYTLEAASEGVTVREASEEYAGSAVASAIGTYEVKLKLKDGFKWKIPADPEEEGSQETTSTEDQTVKFTIEPQKVKIKSAKAGKGKVTVKWSGVKGGVKYQVSAVKVGSDTEKLKKTSKKYATVKKLKRKKSYMIKVRAYKTVNSEPIYGEWSVAKKVKIK